MNLEAYGNQLIGGASGGGGGDQPGLLPHIIVISEHGSVVTITKGTLVISAYETSSGHFEADVPEFGTYTIDAILGGDDAQVSLVVDTVKVYTVDDSHLSATITVTFPKEFGATCSLAATGQTTQYATTSPYTFTVHEIAEYTLTCTYDETDYTDTVNVTASGQSFTSLLPAVDDAATDDISLWLFYGGRTENYTTLSQVLADSTCLSALMADNNAVDYLVRSKAFMGATGGLVPAMTDNTHPSGECITDPTQYSTFYPYFAFDGVIKTTGDIHSWLVSTTDARLIYKFPSAKIINSFVFTNYDASYVPLTYKIQASDDGTTWKDIYSGTNSVLTSWTTWSKVSFPNTEAHQYWAFKYETSTGNSSGCEELQFYFDGLTTNSTAMSYIGLNNYCANTLLSDSDWCEAICNSTYIESVLNVKIPTMTSNTTPSGVAFANYEGVHSGRTYSAYLAMDGVIASNDWWWGGDPYPTPAEIYLGYKFTSAQKIKGVLIQNPIGSSIAANIVSFKLQGSDDGTTYTDIGVETTRSNPTESSGVSITSYPYNETSYQYYRIKITSAQSVTNSGCVMTLQFYGREDV